MNRKHISSLDHYKQYYLNQALQKGGGPYFSGRLFQRGSGIGSVFASLFKRALHFLSRASNHLGKAALKTGANVLADTASGQRFQDSLKNRVKETGRQLKRDAINTLTSQTGSGKKRRKGKVSKLKKKDKEVSVCVFDPISEGKCQRHWAFHCIIVGTFAIVIGSRKPPNVARKFEVDSIF